MTLKTTAKKLAAISSAVLIAIASLFTASPALAEDAAVAAVRAGKMEAARQTFSRRSLPQHFSAMDATQPRGVSYAEMDLYFTAMHIAFDRDRNGIVSVQEAPPLLLRYRLSGRPFPRQGLTQSELRARLQELFSKVDKNRNGLLSWWEMLQ